MIKPIEQELKEIRSQKYFLKSKTIAGIIFVSVVGLLAEVGPVVGLTIGPETKQYLAEHLPLILERLLEAGGLAYATYGRFVAKDRLM